jgi:hypothetical protein
MARMLHLRQTGVQYGLHQGVGVLGSQLEPCPSLGRSSSGASSMNSMLRWLPETAPLWGSPIGARTPTADASAERQEKSRSAT